MTKNEIIERLTSIYESMLINDEDNEAINQAIDVLQSQLQYKRAFEKALFTIIENARKHNCCGCPLKGSGIIKAHNSCKNRLREYYLSGKMEGDMNNGKL